MQIRPRARRNLEQVRGLNQYIDETKPWAIAKLGDKEHLQEVLAYQASCLLEIAELLEPFLPSTAEKIRTIFESGIIRPTQPRCSPSMKSLRLRRKNAMELVDTHCHIHEAADSFIGESETRTRWQRAGKVGSPDGLVQAAIRQGVTRMICVGTTRADSELAVEFVQGRDACWASIGIHPHEAKDHLDAAQQNAFTALVAKPKVVAVGECGLDYFYNHSPKEAQEKILRFQIELALACDLPMIFHVRDAFDDFWPVFDEYQNIRGVIHSFSASQKELDEILKRNLYVGLNGIMTFTKNLEQLAAAKAVPLDRLVVETDAPFLTPVPERGKICEPKHVRLTAQFLSDLRGETLGTFAAETTRNARQLFGLS